MVEATERLGRYLDDELEAYRSEDVDVREWHLEDPDGRNPEAVAKIRGEIERKVASLFDEADG